MDHISIEKCSENSLYEVQVRSDIGGRIEQQDSVYVYTASNMAFALVCDGMGGTDHGALASQMATAGGRDRLYMYLSEQSRNNIPDFLLDTLVELDGIVSCKLGRQKGGSTAVGVFLKGSELYWFSAGDSRLYIFRNGELVQATRDHNYRLRLSEQLEKGEIDQAYFDQEKARGEALISYLGVGGLSVFDLTNVPLELMEGDILLLTTDGLYKAIPQELLRHILSSAATVEKMADKLLAQIQVLKKTIALDNTTYVLIKINAKGEPK